MTASSIPAPSSFGSAFTKARISSIAFPKVVSFFFDRLLKETTRFASEILVRSGGGFEKESREVEHAVPKPLPLVSPFLDNGRRPKPAMFADERTGGKRMEGLRLWTLRTPRRERCASNPRVRYRSSSEDDLGMKRMDRRTTVREGNRGGIVQSM